MLFCNGVWKWELLNTSSILCMNHKLRGGINLLLFRVDLAKRSSYPLNVFLTGSRPIEAKSHTARDDLASLWLAQGSLRLTDSRFARVIVRWWTDYILLMVPRCPFFLQKPRHVMGLWGSGFVRFGIQYSGSSQRRSYSTIATDSIMATANVSSLALE